MRLNVEGSKNTHQTSSVSLSHMVFDVSTLHIGYRSVTIFPHIVSAPLCTVTFGFPNPETIWGNKVFDECYYLIKVLCITMMFHRLINISWCIFNLVIFIIGPKTFPFVKNKLSDVNKFTKYEYRRGPKNDTYHLDGWKCCFCYFQTSFLLIKKFFSRLSSIL